MRSLHDAKYNFVYFAEQLKATLNGGMSVRTSAPIDSDAKV